MSSMKSLRESPGGAVNRRSPAEPSFIQIVGKEDASEAAKSIFNSIKRDVTCSSRSDIAVGDGGIQSHKGTDECAGRISATNAHTQLEKMKVYPTTNGIARNGHSMSSRKRCHPGYSASQSGCDPVAASNTAIQLHTGSPQLKKTPTPHAHVDHSKVAAVPAGRPIAINVLDSSAMGADKAPAAGENGKERKKEKSSGGSSTIDLIAVDKTSSKIKIAASCVDIDATVNRKESEKHTKRLAISTEGRSRLKRAFQGLLLPKTVQVKCPDIGKTLKRSTLDEIIDKSNGHYSKRLRSHASTAKCVPPPPATRAVRVAPSAPLKTVDVSSPAKSNENNACRSEQANQATLKIDPHKLKRISAAFAKCNVLRKEQCRVNDAVAAPQSRTIGVVSANDPTGGNSRSGGTREERPHTPSGSLQPRVGGNVVSKGQKAVSSHSRVAIAPAPYVIGKQAPQATRKQPCHILPKMVSLAPNGKSLILPEREQDRRLMAPQESNYIAPSEVPHPFIPASSNGMTSRQEHAMKLQPAPVGLFAPNTQTGLATKPNVPIVPIDAIATQIQPVLSKVPSTPKVSISPSSTESLMTPLSSVTTTSITSTVCVVSTGRSMPLLAPANSSAMTLSMNAVVTQGSFPFIPISGGKPGQQLYARVVPQDVYYRDTSGCLVKVTGSNIMNHQRLYTVASPESAMPLPKISNVHSLAPAGRVPLTQQTLIVKQDGGMPAGVPHSRSSQMRPPKSSAQKHKSEPDWKIKGFIPNRENRQFAGLVGLEAVVDWLVQHRREPVSIGH